MILALGLFDYLPEPHRFSRRMFELCAPGGCVVGSFPTFSLLKGPVRKVRYEWIGDCPIFNYSRRELELMFGASGFEPVESRAPAQADTSCARTGPKPGQRRRTLDAPAPRPGYLRCGHRRRGRSTRWSAAAR